VKKPALAVALGVPLSAVSVFAVEVEGSSLGWAIAGASGRVEDVKPPAFEEDVATGRTTAVDEVGVD
jgi:hypothetical protein